MIMNGLHLHNEELWKVQDGKKVNVFCVIDQNKERSVIVLDHFTNFKGIYMIVQYNIENGGILVQGKGNYCSKLKKES